MNELRSQSIQKWWPTTQALDLVEGDCDVVAKAVHAEVSRFCGEEVVDGNWEISQILTRLLVPQMNSPMYPLSIW